MHELMPGSGKRIRRQSQTDAPIARTNELTFEINGAVNLRLMRRSDELIRR